MNHYELPRLISFHEHNEERQIPQVLDWLAQGKEIGLVTNAGTPTISDPGFKLVRTCREMGINVLTVPGASAVIAALSVSGLPTDKFFFLGFLPKKEGKKRKLLTMVQTLAQPTTVVAYESPYRLKKTCLLLQELFGDINLTLARELTKIHEEVKTQRISVWLTQLTGKALKGEVVILYNSGA
jgi:16S rRNA (cytidine1402-2'-O)-methyltransferase